jgi:hypothetical protein
MGNAIFGSAAPGAGAPVKLTGNALFEMRAPSFGRVVRDPYISPDSRFRAICPIVRSDMAATHLPCRQMRKACRITEAIT